MNIVCERREGGREGGIKEGGGRKGGGREGKKKNISQASPNKVSLTISSTMNEKVVHV